MKVLDHGYVELVESWGSDERIIESARMSTAKGFKGWGTPEAPGDEKLLQFLWENGHTSPFEQAGITVEVQAPIFVFREWHRHRTQSYNELSGRYTEMPDLVYLPDDLRIAHGAQSLINKQGSVAGKLETQVILGIIEEAQASSRAAYEALIDMGLARELARIVLPLSQYSRMRASANLLNWLRFLSLRQQLSAQWEIRQYANQVGYLIAQAFPRTWMLYAVGRRSNG